MVGVVLEFLDYHSINAQLLFGCRSHLQYLRMRYGALDSCCRCDGPRMRVRMRDGGRNRGIRSLIENNGQKYYLGLLVLVGTYHRV